MLLELLHLGGKDAVLLSLVCTTLMLVLIALVINLDAYLPGRFHGFTSL